VFKRLTLLLLVMSLLSFGHAQGSYYAGGEIGAIGISLYDLGFINAFKVGGNFAFEDIGPNFDVRLSLDVLLGGGFLSEVGVQALYGLGSGGTVNFYSGGGIKLLIPTFLPSFGVLGGAEFMVSESIGIYGELGAELILFVLPSYEVSVGVNFHF